MRPPSDQCSVVLLHDMQHAHFVQTCKEVLRLDISFDLSCVQLLVQLWVHVADSNRQGTAVAIEGKTRQPDVKARRGRRERVRRVLQRRKWHTAVIQTGGDSPSRPSFAEERL